MPHVCEALYAELKRGQVAGVQSFPKVDEAALVQDEIELMLQVSGKLRGAIRVSAQADKASIEQLALASDAFTKHSGGAPVKKVIVVPGRLVNVVV